MHSTHHAALSLLASVLAVIALEPAAPIVLVLAGTVVGVAIDFDHFPIARARSGDWESLGRVARNPLLVVTDPERIFSGARVHPLERLLTHALVGGPLAVGAWLWWPTLSVVLGTSLYVHVVADLAWDVRRLSRSGAP